MPSEPRARLLAASALALAALAACTSGPPRPTTPTYTGILRPDPSRPARPGDPLPSEPVSERYAESRNAYMPRHIPRNELGAIKRIAVLLPFSSTNAEVQKQSRGIYNAIQMALFENAPGVVLMPRDASSSDPQVVAGIAQESIKDGALAVIGPVFAQQVAAVAGQAAEVRAPVLAFSTDVSAIGQGAYLMSLTPTSEVERIVDWAAKEGVTRFAMFGPDTANGHSIEQILRQEVAERGGNVFAVEYYAQSNPSPQTEARRLAGVVDAEKRTYSGKIAVLIPEQGVQLRSVGALLRSVANATPREVRFLGTGAWNDPDVWRESALSGGAFPAPDPAALGDFEKRYQAIYGEAAPRLASFGYDAGALAATLANAERLDAAMIQRPQGWSGVNGLFRFLPDGSVERALAVMQLQDRAGVKIVSPPVQAFSAGS